MASVEDEVRLVIRKFYDALEDLTVGRGTDAMVSVWHHGDEVTTVHPFGHWARGWAEVEATWNESAAMLPRYRGHDGRDDTVGSVHDLHVVVFGDCAYSTCVFRAKLYAPDGSVMETKLNCTNALRKIDGEWKMHHHHPDQATPEFNAKLAELLA